MQIARRVKVISYLAHGSKSWYRGKSSFAASVPCDAPEVRKTGKRMPIDKRRALVELFVNRYRSENLGKFPSARNVVKEVGGSFYVVRKMVQELEYNSKLQSSNAGKEVLSEEGVIARNEFSSLGLKSKAEKYQQSSETSLAKTPDDVKAEEICESLLDIVPIMNTEVNQPLPKVSCVENSKDADQQSSCQSVLERDAPGSKIEEYQLSSKHSLLKKQENTQEEELNQSVPDINTLKSNGEGDQSLPEFLSTKKPEYVKEDTSCKSVLDVDISEGKEDEPQPSHKFSVLRKPEDTKKEEPDLLVDSIDGSESEGEKHQKSPRELSEDKTEEKIQIKPSIWGNLKSVAEGIMNMWRKR